MLLTLGIIDKQTYFAFLTMCVAASSSTVYTANSQSKALVKFSKNWDIEAAYSNMTSTVETILTAGDFPQLRRACIHKIKSLKSKLPHKLIPQIKTTSCMNELLDTLAESEYWNWFDTRLLEALTYASGSPEAIQLLEHFKKTFYPRKISEFIPYQLVKPFKEFVSMKDKFDKEPSEVTVYELLEHRYKLEYEVLDIDEGELVLSCIKTGCVELTWQLPQELVYCAYISMKRKHDELSSLAVKSLICEIADVYAGLPILWCGQEVGEVGPIEPLPKHVRQEPYSLPQGFHWVSLSSSDAEEVEKFSYKHGQSLLNLSVFIFDFCSQYPNNRNEWQFSIKTANGKLASVVLAYPITMIVGGVSLTCVYPYMLNHLKYIGKRLWFVIIKELMRRVSSYNINHFVFSIPKSSVLKPVSTVHLWKYYFDHSTSSQLHSSPRTPGWRRMTLEDVPSALALINKWSSQFEIRQVFISEEEFMYHFLSATPLSSMITYIVENETNNITDLVSFRFKDVSHGDVMITAVVSTQSPVKQLIIDALVCVKENGGKSLLILQNDIKPDVLVSLSFQYAHTLTYSIYNYRYHEISGNKFYCFAF